MAEITEAQKKLIRDSWKHVEDHVDETGIDMFLKMFGDNPSLIPLFKFTNKKPLEELRDDKRLQRHASGVIRTVGVAVSMLDDLSTLVTTLEGLAGKHVQYGVTSNLFEPVGAALLYALGNRMNDSWTPDVKNAWVTVYEVVVAVMKPVIDKAQQAK